jgi:hypothetical protein
MGLPPTRWMRALVSGVFAVAAACGPTVAPSAQPRGATANVAPGSIAETPVSTPPPQAPSPEHLAALKKRFVFNPDKIRGGGAYVPRSQTADNSFDRSYLGAEVLDGGDVALKSHYTGEDWIFHTRVLARVGSQVIETADVPTYDALNNRYNGSGVVWEVILFTNGRDNGLLEAIATHPNDTIRVRMIGESMKEFILSARDKNAIRDSYELAQLLRP